MESPYWATGTWAQNTWATGTWGTVLSNITAFGKRVAAKLPPYLRVHHHFKRH